MKCETNPQRNKQTTTYRPADRPNEQTNERTTASKRNNMSINKTQYTFNIEFMYNSVDARLQPGELERLSAAFRNTQHNTWLWFALLCLGLR